MWDRMVGNKFPDMPKAEFFRRLDRHNIDYDIEGTTIWFQDQHNIVENEIIRSDEILDLLRVVGMQPIDFYREHLDEIEAQE